MFDTARQYRESFDVYGTKKSFEWSLVEGEEHVIHTAKKSEHEIASRVKVPDFAHLLRDEPEWRARAESLAARTLDLLSFVDRIADPPALPPSTLPDVTYHSFCQSTNVLGISAVGPRLLQRAGVPLVELPEMEVCCGFGGGASIDHPKVSRGIVARKLDNVTSTGANVLCTDNPGCVLHLRGAAHAAGLPVDVKHVAEILALALNR